MVQQPFANSRQFDVAVRYLVHIILSCDDRPAYQPDQPIKNIPKKSQADIAISLFMCYSLNQGVFYHMKKIRGIVVLLAVLTVLAIATVAQADSTMGGCVYDTAGNIVWCWL